MSTTVLQTDRLLLRAFTAADREPFAALNADPEVMEHFVAPLTRAESDAFVDRIDEHFAEHGWGLWALERRSDGAFLGFTGLTTIGFDAPFDERVEVGWRLARHAWGQGYATEAARAALSFGLERFERIVSFTALTNARSQAVMERLGMRRVGEFEHPRVPAGHPIRPHVLYVAERGVSGPAARPAA